MSRIAIVCIVVSGCAHVYKPTNIQYKPRVFPEIVMLEDMAGDNIDKPLNDAIVFWNNTMYEIMGKKVLIKSRRMIMTDDGRVPFIAVKIASTSDIRMWRDSPGGSDHVGGSIRLFYDGIYPDRYISGAVLKIKDEGLTSEKVLYMAFLHELGHYLGIDHSSYPDTIMFFNPTSRSLSLAPDTKEQINRLYGDSSEQNH